MRYLKLPWKKPSMARPVAGQPAQPDHFGDRRKRQGFPGSPAAASSGGTHSPARSDGQSQKPSMARPVAGQPSLRRRGFTTLEVIAAASVITVALASITPLFVRHARLVAESRRERIALEELANQAEQLAVVAGGDLAHHLATLAVSPEVADHLPGARLQARRGVATPLGEPVVLSLTWNSPGRNDHPLALVTWLPIPPPQTEKTP